MGSLAEIDHLLDDDYEDQSSVHLFFVKYKYKHKYKTNTIDHLPDDDYDDRSSVHSLSPVASWPSLRFGIKEQEGGATKWKYKVGSYNRYKNTGFCVFVIEIVFVFEIVLDLTN